MLLLFKKNKVSGKTTLVLAGDIDALKTNLALFKMEGSHTTSLRGLRTHQVS